MFTIWSRQGAPFLTRFAKNFAWTCAMRKRYRSMQQLIRCIIRYVHTCNLTKEIDTNKLVNSKLRNYTKWETWRRRGACLIDIICNILRNEFLLWTWEIEGHCDVTKMNANSRLGELLNFKRFIQLYLGVIKNPFVSYIPLNLIHPFRTLFHWPPLHVHVTFRVTTRSHSRFLGQHWNPLLWPGTRA